MCSTAANTAASITAWARVKGMVIARKGPGRRSANDDPSAATGCVAGSLQRAWRNSRAAVKIEASRFSIQ